MTRRLRFFLGGADLEMAEIARLVAARLGPGAVIDSGLEWGARLSMLAGPIAAATAAGLHAVAVELADDMAADWPARAALTLVDHHGERAGGPSSLRQVFTLLGLPALDWTRRMALVEANDVDHIAGLFAAGASAAEVAAIRAEDRAAQGVTAEEEAAGRTALARARADFGGALWRVDLPHRRMATVMDPLALRLWPRRPQALVVAPGEIAFFGAGAGVLALDAAFPGGWRGGGLPEHGFWGHAGGAGAPPPTAQAARAVLANASIFPRNEIFEAERKKNARDLWK